MPEPDLLPERIFGLSAIDGRRSVRPGEVIGFQFRVKNGSEVATPQALLVLVLPHGWSPLDPLEADIPPVQPGAEHTATFRVRPDVADGSTADSPVQAALHLGTLVLGSNVVPMRVFGSPRLNGPASSVRIQSVEEGALRVLVVVSNEGDAAAHDVRVVAPPPPGFVADETAIVATCEELGVGETLSYAYTMVPVGPAAAMVCIDDAHVSFDGGHVALVTGVTTLLAPVLVAPEVVTDRRATRLDMAVRIENAGWVAARDVRCVVDLSAGWRVLRGTLRADGAPATIRRDGDVENGVSIVVPLVPARGHVDLTLVASASHPNLEGEIRVRCGTHTVSVAIPHVSYRALRIDARPESAFAEPGEAVAISFEAHNTGETAERVTVVIDGERCWNGELRAGAAAAFRGHVAIPVDIADGEAIEVLVEANGDDGAHLATTRFTLRAIDRPWVAIDSVVWVGGKTRVTMRNVGATTARNIHVLGESEPRVLALAPGETQMIIVEPAIARSGSIAGHDGRSVPIAWDDQAPPVVVAAQLLAAAAARRGERLDIRLRVSGAAALQTLRLRPIPHAAAVYVAGSSTINGHAVVDGVEGPPLFSERGLALHDVPAGTVVELAWSLLPHTPGDVVIAVDIEANGERVMLEPLVISIADAPLFGARPSALPFHIDAATVGDRTSAAPDPGQAAAWPVAEATSIDELPTAPVPSVPDAWALAAPAPVAEASDPAHSELVNGPAITTSLILDAERSAGIVRVLRGARGIGLISHVPSLAVLFPNAIVSGDAAFDQAFAVAADAVRGIYERLFVKLRIPGYDVRSSDIEDEATRRNLLALLHRISAATDAPAGARAYGEFHARIDRARIADACAVLANAPLGGPHTLAAVAALLPRYGATDAAAAVGAYVSLLSREFERTCARSDVGFTLYLTNHAVPELDTARALACDVLESRSEITSS